MFGFLGTITQDISHVAGTVADDVRGAIDGAVNAAQNDPALGGLVQRTVTNVRTDLANAVADLGAGATTALTKKISPANAPVLVPLSATAQRWLAAVVVLVVILLAVLFWRRK